MSHIPSGRVKTPPRKRRNELKSGGEATQFDLGSSHGTPSCPFPDESVLHVRCLRYAESPSQSVVCGEDLGRKRAAAVPGDTCVAWAARALSFFFPLFFFLPFPSLRLDADHGMESMMERNKEQRKLSDKV